MYPTAIAATAVSLQPNDFPRTLAGGLRHLPQWQRGSIEGAQIDALLRFRTEALQSPAIVLNSSSCWWIRSH